MPERRRSTTPCAPTASSFDHNLHALRIVTWFEERYPAFRGLNLTLAVREGIVKHSRDYSARDHPELAEYFLDRFPPLEAQLIDLADEIAYLTADLDDGLDSGILALDQVLDAVPLFRGFHDAARAKFPAAAPRLAIYEGAAAASERLGYRFDRRSSSSRECARRDDSRRNPECAAKTGGAQRSAWKRNASP